MRSTGASRDRDVQRVNVVVGLLMLIAVTGCSDGPSPTRAVGGDPSDAAAKITSPEPEARRTSTSSPGLPFSSPPPFPTAPSALPTAPPPTAVSSADGPVYTAIDGAVVEGGEIGTIFNLADVRVGRHDGFTRIVWEMEEAEGRPFHRVVTRVREDGSPVQPFGRHWLEVSISDVYAWTRPELLESRRVDLDGAVTVLQQLMIGDDAIYSVGVGLAGPVRFELGLLERPVRLVLDVFDDGS